MQTAEATEKKQQNSLLRTQCFANGQWIDAASGKSFDVTNPSTGAIVASVPDMNVEDLRKVIDAANTAWPAYRDLTAGQRAALLKKWYALILEHKTEIATLMTLESGKVIS